MQLGERPVRELLEHDREPVYCAEADLSGLASRLVTLVDEIEELERAATIARERWASADHIDELRIALHEIQEAARVWRSGLALHLDRIQRFRDAGDHYHLVGGQLLRLVPASAGFDAAHPDDDIPF